MAYISSKSDKFNKTQSSWKMKESSLHEPIKTWLEGLGYEVFSEVPYPSSFSFIDIVGKRENSLLCVELKSSLNKKVLHQANYSKMITEDVYIAVLSTPNKKSIDFCQKLGIGVISVKNNNLTILCEPTNLGKTWDRFYISVKETLSNGGFKGVAGLPNMKGTGPAQKVLELVDKALLDNPKTTWKELFDKIPNHYSSYKSMQQAIGKARDRKIKT